MEKVEVKVKNDRHGERGAALVMALLITALLLIVTAGLLLEASMNTYNVTDATAEQQAYNAAESGIQAALYVLRDNVTLPDSMRLDMTKPATDKANRINYVRALEPSMSNIGTTGLDSTPRLSRWLPYSTTSTDKVVMGGASGFSANGYAFDIKISDPDHTGKLVTYSARGKLYDSECSPTAFAGCNNARKVYNGVSANDRLVIEFMPLSPTQVDTTSGFVSTNFGNFRVTKYGNGAQIPDHNRFEIIISMTQPYWGLRVIRGYIRPNTCSPDCTIPGVYFDSKTYTIQGSQIALTSLGSNAITAPYTEGPPAGFAATLNSVTTLGSPTDSAVQGNLTSPEPIRLVISSTGYGPRGSVKRLEAIVQKNFFNGLAAPATLTLVGPNSTSVPATTFNFHPGSSNQHEYSGQDVDSTDIIPPIGTTGQANLNLVHDSVDGQPPHPYNGEVIGVPTDVSMDMPPWLASPEYLDATIKQLQTVADSSGRYFPSGVQPSSAGNYATGQGITFCDGDCELAQDGGGILVVTGKLTLRGAFNFKGIIIVTGQAGIDRQGSGNAFIYGNVVVAPYVNSSVLPASDPVGTSFLAPQYDLSGGGTGGIQFSSTAINDSLLAVNNFVLGVVEK